MVSVCKGSVIHKQLTACVCVCVCVCVFVVSACEGLIYKQLLCVCVCVCSPPWHCCELSLAVELTHCTCSPNALRPRHTCSHWPPSTADRSSSTEYTWFTLEGGGVWGCGGVQWHTDSVYYNTNRLGKADRGIGFRNGSLN